MVHTQFHHVAVSMSLLVLIIKAANESNKDNDVPKLIFCTRKWNIWMRPKIEKPDNSNRRLELAGLANPGKTRRLRGTGPGLAHQSAAGRVLERVWNGTERLFRSKPGPLAVYPDPLLTPGCAHLTPGMANSSRTGDGRNKWWIVNSCIDLATWNDVYH